MEIRLGPGGRIEALIEGESQSARFLPLGPGRALLERGGVRLPLRWAARGAERWLTLRGAHAHLTSVDPVEAAAGSGAGGGHHPLMAPLPGTVVSVAVEPGQEVAQGDLLLVVEAMKMEHRIAAPYSGKVTQLHFAAGDAVDKDDLLLDLEAEK